jgi:hypothetical protein
MDARGALLQIAFARLLTRARSSHRGVFLTSCRVRSNLKPEHISAWLTPTGRSLEELQGILSDRQAPLYEHEVLAA